MKTVIGNLRNFEPRRGINFDEGCFSKNMEKVSLRGMNSYSKETNLEIHELESCDNSS